FEAVQRVAPRLRGGYALAFVSADEPETIVATRRGAPLIVGLAEHHGFVASDIAALVGATRELFQLGDDEVARIGAGDLEVVGPGGAAVEPRPLTVTWDVSAA